MARTHFVQMRILRLRYCEIKRPSMSPRHHHPSLSQCRPPKRPPGNSPPLSPSTYQFRVNHNANGHQNFPMPSSLGLERMDCREVQRCRPSPPCRHQPNDAPRWPTTRLSPPCHDPPPHGISLPTVSPPHLPFAASKLASLHLLQPARPVPISRRRTRASSCFTNFKRVSKRQTTSSEQRCPSAMSLHRCHLAYPNETSRVYLRLLHRTVPRRRTHVWRLCRGPMRPLWRMVTSLALRFSRQMAGFWSTTRRRLPTRVTEFHATQSPHSKPTLDPPRPHLRRPKRSLPALVSPRLSPCP